MSQSSRLPFVGVRRKVLQRFESNTIPEPNTGCVFWLGSTRIDSGKEYGIICDGLQMPVHRWAYQKFVGPLKKKEKIASKCGNTLCCNPDHWIKPKPSRTREYCREKTKKHRAAKLARMVALKSNPCADCRVSYPPYVMDFDHVRGEKLCSVSDLLTASEEKLMAEIAKCDLVCANCHRIRTQSRIENAH